MNRNWNEQVSSAQRALDNACDCCDHGPREAAGEVDSDWTIGGKRQSVITVAEANRLHREWLARSAS